MDPPQPRITPKSAKAAFKVLYLLTILKVLYLHAVFEGLRLLAVLNTLYLLSVLKVPYLLAAYCLRCSPALLPCTSSPSSRPCTCSHLIIFTTTAREKEHTRWGTRPGETKNPLQLVAFLLVSVQFLATPGGTWCCASPPPQPELDTCLD